MEKNQGITLVALVITVIILILAGTAISLITGEDGLFAKANHAASLYNQKAKEEAEMLNQLIAGNYISSNTNLDPVPELETTYLVQYNANGGNGAPSAQDKESDIDLTLSSTKPSRSNFVFLGWGTSSTATNATYQPGDTYNKNADITLYAIWEASEKLVPVFAGNSGYGGDTELTIADGSVTKWRPESGEKDGYLVLDYGGFVCMDKFEFTGYCNGYRTYYNQSFSASITVNWILEATNDISSDSWEEIDQTTWVTASNGNTEAFEFTSKTGKKYRYYRLRFVSTPYALDISMQYGGYVLNATMYGAYFEEVPKLTPSTVTCTTVYSSTYNGSISNGEIGEWRAMANDKEGDMIIDYGREIYLNRFLFKSMCRGYRGYYNQGFDTSMRINYTLYGSNDSSTWEKIGETLWETLDTHYAEVLEIRGNQNKSYRYLKLHFESSPYALSIEYKYSGAMVRALTYGTYK